MKLSDKYTQLEGSVYLTGIQALVRLPMDQMRLDKAAGLNTGCFISGYEGSPLGGYDFALQRAGKLLSEHNIHFWPALNEDLAATAIFGSQIHHTLGALGPANVDGVVGIWYGKGPGVDRSGDILRHANLSGSPGRCATLVLAGDDHPCKSSSIPHQSDLSLYNVNIPILFPGNTQEILDYGLYGIALSRHTGAWAALKLLTQTCDGGGTVDINLSRHRFYTPAGYEKKTDARLVPGIALGLEYETNVRRLQAIFEFSNFNQLNRRHGADEGARIGIATAGKYYYDVMQAFTDLGVDEDRLRQLGIRIAKFGMTYPLDPAFSTAFAAGLEKIIVVEEKRSFLEFQLRDVLYNTADHPRIAGKQDDSGAPLFPAAVEMDPDLIARALARLIPDLDQRKRVALLDRTQARPKEFAFQRLPNYCSGCPHNRSTLLLEGQAAGGGIGCHGMGFLLQEYNRGYLFSTQMGGEGAAWIGMAPFVERGHLFQNIGDGTYFHSGSLAIQAAISAGVNITFKLLYNGHVAMTGGQDAVGAIPIPALTRKLEAEGVRKIIVLAEDADKYSDPSGLASNCTVRDRNDLEKVLRELERISGVTVMIYDQECAAEKRRPRSRGRYAEPTERLVIHERVCEGCGDCVKQSNCMSLHPVETAYGQKMKIHQPSCNKDYTCALGDCPSFVTVKIKPGTGLKRPPLAPLLEGDLPNPLRTVSLEGGYRILSPGIGGTGVVTINALIATAALMEGLSVLSLDQTGLAQKGGAVVSHLILSKAPLAASVKINTANADLILGFDLVGVMHADNLKCAHPDRTVAVVNTHLIPTAESIRRRQSLGDPSQPLTRLEEYTRGKDNVYADASHLSERLFGTHMMTNMILLGAAWQGRFVPVKLSSLESAIRINGVEVDKNLAAFRQGRLLFQQPALPRPPKPEIPTIDYYVELTRYQNARYADRHRRFVERVRSVSPELAALVEPHLFKLMMIKDEYEVARLLTDPEFERQLHDQWESIESISFNLHPPLLRRFGLSRKIRIRRSLLRILAALKPIRGTFLDVFGYTAHRRQERALIDWYCGLIEEVLSRPNSESARELACLPDQIRGYEKIKEESIRVAHASGLRNDLKGLAKKT